MCKGQKIQSKDKRKREKYKISDGQNQTNKSAEIELSNLRNPVDSDTFQNVSKQSLQNPRYLDENKEDWEEDQGMSSYSQQELEEAVEIVGQLLFLLMRC